MPWTPLHYAAQKRMLTEVERMLKTEGGIAMLKETSNSSNAFRSYTPLEIAIECGNVGIVVLMLKHGLEANGGDAVFEYYLRVAARNLHCDVLKALLEHEEPIFISVRNKALPGLLRDSIMWGSSFTNVVDTILDFLGATDDFDGNVDDPLNMSRIEAVEKKMKKHLKTKTNQTSITIGDTALIAAARTKNKRAIALLLDHGADPSFVNSVGKCARDLAPLLVSECELECRALSFDGDGVEEPEYALVLPSISHSTSHVSEPWYVGKMNRAECKVAVTSGNPGDFLVRDSTDGKKMVIVLCGRGQGETANYQILRGDNHMYIVSGVPYRHVSDVLQSMRDNHPNGNDGKPLPLGKVANYGQIVEDAAREDSSADDEDEAHWTCSKCNCMTEEWPCDVCGADGLWDQRGVERDVWRSMLAGAPSGTCVVRDSTGGSVDCLAVLTVVKSGGGAYFNQSIISGEAVAGTSARVQLHGSKNTHDSIESLLKFYQDPMYFAKSTLLDVPSVLIIPSSSRSIANVGHQAFGNALDKALGKAKHKAQHKASKSKTLCADGKYRSLWYRKTGTGVQDETYDPDGTRGTLYGNIFDAIDGGTLGQQMMFSRMVSGDTYFNQKFNPLEKMSKTPLLELTDALKLIDKYCADDLAANGKEALTFAEQHSHAGTVQRTGGEALTVLDIAVLHLYTMETDFYSRMNQELGGYGKGASHAALDDFLPITKLLVVAMQKLPPVPAKLFRGITMDYRSVLGKRIKATDLVRWCQFTSCSTRPDVLKDESFLGEKKEGTVFQIMSVTGVNIKAYSKLADEDEVVLPPGSQFVVEKITKWKFGVNEVRMRQIVPDGVEVAGANKTKTMCSDGTFRSLCYLEATGASSSAPLAYTDVDTYMDAVNDYDIAADGGAGLDGGIESDLADGGDGSDGENDYDLTADYKPISRVQKGKGGAAASGPASAAGGGDSATGSTGTFYSSGLGASVGAAGSTATFYSSGLGASDGAAGSIGTFYSSGLDVAIAGVDGNASSDDVEFLDV